MVSGMVSTTTTNTAFLGVFRGQSLVSPNSNLMLPEFLLERYEVISSNPGLVFHSGGTLRSQAVATETSVPGLSPTPSPDAGDPSHALCSSWRTRPPSPRRSNMPSRRKVLLWSMPAPAGRPWPPLTTQLPALWSWMWGCRTSPGLTCTGNPAPRNHSGAFSDGAGRRNRPHRGLGNRGR